MKRIIDEEAVRASARREWSSSAAVREEFLDLKTFEAFSVANAKGLARMVNGQVRTLNPKKQN